MKKITRWSPDTCGCVIDFEWDTNDPNAPHVGKTVVSACECHPSEDAVTHHSKLLEENQGKNKALKIIADNLAGYANLTDTGSTIPDTAKLSFAFDKDRKIIITAKKISEQDRSTVQAALDSQLGPGKVSVNG